MRVRVYEKTDWSAVREICCDTTDAGEPVEGFFSDREFIADLVTRYYTDYETRSSWVAESDGRVVGYLNGCLDAGKHRRLSRWVAGLAIAKTIARGALFRLETWRWLRALHRTWKCGGAVRRVPLEAYPAHLHVNVRKEARNLGAGPRLVEKFFEQARAARLPGVHVTVRGDNEAGCRFFERMGFTDVARYPMIVARREGSVVTHVVIYAKKL